jgi:GTP pyrophosphokinase
MASRLHELDEQQKDEAIPLQATARQKKDKRSSSSINVLGVGNLLTTVANCCMPVPHDDIIGYITKDRGVSVHRTDCKNIIHLKDKEQARLVEVEWGDTEVQNYPVKLLINANDRHGLLSDITKTLSDDKINVIAVNTMSNKKEQTARMAVTIEIRDLQQLTRIIDKISRLRNVIEVKRGASSEVGSG